MLRTIAIEKNAALMHAQKEGCSDLERLRQKSKRGLEGFSSLALGEWHAASLSRASNARRPIFFKFLQRHARDLIRVVER